MKCLIVLVVVAVGAEIGYSLPQSLALKQDGSGLYCTVTEKKGFVECSKENSELPSDFKIDPTLQTTEFICLNTTYTTGFVFTTDHHLEQCTFNLKEGNDLCGAITKAVKVKECNTTATTPASQTSSSVSPYSSTTTTEKPNGSSYLRSSLTILTMLNLTLFVSNNNF